MICSYSTASALRWVALLRFLSLSQLLHCCTSFISTQGALRSSAVDKRLIYIGNAELCNAVEYEWSLILPCSFFHKHFPPAFLFFFTNYHWEFPMHKPLAKSRSFCWYLCIPCHHGHNQQLTRWKMFYKNQSYTCFWVPMHANTRLKLVNLLVDHISSFWAFSSNIITARLGNQGSTRGNLPLLWRENASSSHTKLCRKLYTRDKKLRKMAKSPGCDILISQPDHSQCHQNSAT